MAYADLNSIHNPATGTSPPATWGDQVRDNFEYFNGILPQGAGAWTAFNGILITQSVNVNRNVIYSRYHKVGRKVTLQFYLGVTGAGTASQTVTVSLPFTAVTAGMPCGDLYVYDASVGIVYHTMGHLLTTGTMAGLVSGSAGTNLGVATFTAGLANTDSVLGICHYESTT